LDNYHREEKSTEDKALRLAYKSEVNDDPGSGLWSALPPWSAGVTFFIYQAFISGIIKSRIDSYHR